MGLGSAMPSRVSTILSAVVNSGFADPVHQPYWKVKAQVEVEEKEPARRLTLTSTATSLQASNLSPPASNIKLSTPQP